MLVRVADCFVNLPATPIAVPPPGAGLLYAVFLVVIFLLVVRISEANSQRHLRFIVPVLLLLAGFIWASRPVADGILFARHVPQLILPVQAQADDKAANGGILLLPLPPASDSYPRFCREMQPVCWQSSMWCRRVQVGSGMAHIATQRALRLSCIGAR